MVSIVGLQLGDVGVELVGQRRRAGRGADVVLHPEQVLELVPAGPRRVVLVGEVVDAGVDGAVDVLDQAGDGLDALPRLAGRGEGVLGRLHVAGPHGVGEHLDVGHQRVDLLA